VEFILIILNYVTCLPVLLAVGGFRFVLVTRIYSECSRMCSIYHFNALLGNTTTIERWEKDKAAIMVRRGKISEVCRWDFLFKCFTDSALRSNFPM